MLNSSVLTLFRLNTSDGENCSDIRDMILWWNDISSPSYIFNADRDSLLTKCFCIIGMSIRPRISHTFSVILTNDTPCTVSSHRPRPGRLPAPQPAVGSFSLAWLSETLLVPFHDLVAPLEQFRQGLAV